MKCWLFDLPLFQGVGAGDFYASNSEFIVIINLRLSTFDIRLQSEWKVSEVNALCILAHQTGFQRHKHFHLMGVTSCLKY